MDKKFNLSEYNKGIDEMSEDYIEKPIAPLEARSAFGPSKVGNSLMHVIKGFGKKYGFANVDIIENWKEIAGDDLSLKITPVKISFPFGERKNGVLWVKIKNASLSSVIQYQFPMVVDKVNTYFGYNAITSVKIKY